MVTRTPFGVIFTKRPYELPEDWKGVEVVTGSDVPSRADPFEDIISIKMEPELRHALAHFYYAIESLAHGRTISALVEIKSIQGLVSFDGDDDSYEAWYRERIAAKEKRDEGLQGQGERQELQEPTLPEDEGLRKGAGRSAPGAG